jgi:hypothetical protein
MAGDEAKPSSVRKFYRKFRDLSRFQRNIYWTEPPFELRQAAAFHSVNNSYDVKG